MLAVGVLSAMIRTGSKLHVLKYLLEERARTHADQPYAVFGKSRQWTYAEMLAETRKTAAGLQALGVKRGCFVLIALPNGPDALRVWFAVNYLGAVAVHVNAAYRGALLERVVNNSGAGHIVTTGDFVAHLTKVDPGSLECVVYFGSIAKAPDGLRLVHADELDRKGAVPEKCDDEILPFETQSVIYTSGTTGPSKGVLCSYQHILTAGHAVYFLTRKDRYLVNLPMYHIAGQLPCMLMLSLGGSVAVIDRFKTDTFWETIAETGATFAILLGVMTRFLLNQPKSGAEQARILRHIIQQPYDKDAPALKERFGIDVYTSFNMTEISLPIVSQANPSVPGTCGTRRDGVELRIVDEYDCEIPQGETGELIIRTDQPWSMMHGYLNEPEATARAWRNGWFHTGDMFRMDEKGHYFFVDRLKDSIRRRGENISSFEVEAAVLAHPDIREAAAVAVDSDISESEVLVAISLKKGSTLKPEALIDFLKPNLAYFMMPRYVRIMDTLPKTPTQKTEKHLLRREGLSAGDCWDRESAGNRVDRG